MSEEEEERIWGRGRTCLRKRRNVFEEEEERIWGRGGTYLGKRRNVFREEEELIFNYHNDDLV